MKMSEPTEKYGGDLKVAYSRCLYNRMLLNLWPEKFKVVEDHNKKALIDELNSNNEMKGKQKDEHHYCSYSSCYFPS